MSTASGAAGGDNDPRVLAAKALLAQAGEDDGDLAVAEAALAVAIVARDKTSKAKAAGGTAGGAAGGDNDPRVLAAKALLSQASEDDGDLAVAEAALAAAHVARAITSAAKGRLQGRDPRFKAVKELFEVASMGDGDLTKANAAFLALELTIHQEKAVMQAKLRKDQADRKAVKFAAKTAKWAEYHDLASNL